MPPPTDVRRRAGGRGSQHGGGHAGALSGSGAISGKAGRIYRLAVKVLVEPANLWFPVGCVLLAAEAALGMLIVNKVPYTEIDWSTYMQQVDVFANGTRNYSLISGDTGPLVYPAGHLYCYWLLQQLTDGDIRRAQVCFVAFYLVTMFIVFKLYAAVGNMPPYLLLIMCATSYRVHSIFMLRLFNDPLVMLAMYATAMCFVHRKWTAAAVVYSIAVSIKMNALLFAPAVALITLVHCGWLKSIMLGLLSVSVQVLIGLPFLISAPIDYVNGAFNLGRVFLHEWTVNWRFLPIDVFVSKQFHLALLAGHVVTLVALAGFVWLKRRGGVLNVLKKRRKLQLAAHEMLYILFTSNLAGMLWARSLHYQFYVWYYHSLPFLLWSSRYPPWLRFVVLAAVELCWNVYPSTAVSSLALHAAHAALLAAAVW